jgi:hypothetical protein
VTDKRIIILHDTVLPSGLTIKETNLLIGHGIPLGTEVKYREEQYGRTVTHRLQVLYHARDCDGTPLYVIGSPGTPVWQEGQENRMYSREVMNGIRENKLRVASIRVRISIWMRKVRGRCTSARTTRRLPAT